MKIQEAYEKLKEAYAEFEGEEEWKKYLDFSARFKGYSMNNTVMIYKQNPEARYVKGYKAWQKLDRTVRKGETGIRIFAPLIRKAKEPDTKDEIKGYRVATVFDLSQTEGDETQLPVLLKGLEAKQDYTELLDQLLRKVDIPVVMEDLKYTKHGSYLINEKKIRLNSERSALQKVKTLFHELAHHYHLNETQEKERTRKQKEFVAESTAYLLCAMHGIDTGEYSIPYLRGWIDDFEAFQEMRRDIERTVKSILKLIEREEAV